MTEIRTTWTSTLESMRQMGIANPRIQARITESIDDNKVQETLYMLLYDSLGHEMGISYDDRNQLRIDAVTRFNINPGSAEYYIRRLFPFDWKLEKATGQRIFIYLYNHEIRENYMEGYQANLLGFNDEGVVLERCGTEPYVVSFSDAMGAVVVRGQDRDKLNWLLDYPVTQYPLVPKRL